MLGTKELALLNVKLGTPMAASDIMEGATKLDDETRFALHDDISDKQPDTALLAIATSARQLASRFADKCPNLKILGMECDRIIEEYGAMWLKNAEGGAIDEAEIIDTLSYTAEDLEGIGELLEYSYSSLREVNYEAAELCDIFQVQARAHALIADAFIEAADLKTIVAAPTSTVKEVYTNNVIPFPTLRA